MFLFTVFFGLGYGIFAFTRSEDVGFKAWFRYTLKGVMIGFCIELLIWAMIISYSYMYVL